MGVYSTDMFAWCLPNSKAPEKLGFITGREHNSDCVKYFESRQVSPSNLNNLGIIPTNY